MSSAIAAHDGVPEIPLEVGDEPYRVNLRLRRYGRERDASNHVLLLHGANTSSDTFRLPDGGLTRYLTDRGWHVWLLDWRGSPHVVDGLPTDRWLGGSPIAEIRHYTVDDVARYDIPAAIKEIRKQIKDDKVPLSVLGHCVGGGSLSIAIATGALKELGVEKVVLSTLGLFYEVTWNGWLKVEDFILERILGNDPDCGGISPRGSDDKVQRAWPWPEDMELAYETFPGAWLPRGDGPGGQMFRRLAFMIGEPYATNRLNEELRAGETDRIFGPLHMGLYLHVGQMARRGYAAPLDARNVIDRARLARGRPVPRSPEGYLDHEPFLGLKKITLLCAAANQVWHRDAMDLMYEWLRSNGANRPGRASCQKLVFPGYNIQELYWGETAVEDVYSKILDGL